MRSGAKYTFLTLVLLLAVVGAFISGRKEGRQGLQAIICERVDTLILRDTITQIRPLYLTKRVIDSVYIPATDTVRILDTVFVLVTREQIRWEDSLAVVYASGVRPQIDSVVHYPRTVVITQSVPVTIKQRPRWGLGVQAGAGVSKDGLSPYVGVGVTYNFLTW